MLRQLVGPEVVLFGTRQEATPSEEAAFTAVDYRVRTFHGKAGAPTEVGIIDPGAPTHVPQRLYEAAVDRSTAMPPTAPQRQLRKA